MNIAIRLDRCFPPEGGIPRRCGGEVRFAGWLELLRALESELEELAKALPEPEKAQEKERSSQRPMS